MNTPIIGIIGLGDIGGGMAASAVRAGMTVIGYDIAPDALNRAQAAGVQIAPDRAALITGADVIVTSLAQIHVIEDSFFARDGVFTLARPGQAVIECSTVPPEFARRLSGHAAELRLRHLEASVIGLGKDARNAALYYLLSGTSEPCPEALAFLAATGRGHSYLGGTGTAAVAKVLNNAIGYSTIVAIAEALAVARRNNIDTAQFVNAVMAANGSGASVVFDRHAARMAGHGDAPKDPSPIGQKDSEATAEVLAATGAQCPVLDAMVATYRAALPGSDVDNQVSVARHIEAAQNQPNKGPKS